MERVRRRLGVILLAAALCAPEAFGEAKAGTASAEMPRYLLSSWDRLSSVLTTASGLLDKQETLPDKAFFGEDKRSNAKELDAVRERAIEILLGGSAVELHRQSKSLREEISALQLKRDGLRNQSVSANESAWIPSWVPSWLSSWAPGTETRPKIAEEIAALDREIESDKKAEAETRNKIAGALRDMGIGLSDAQIDALLSSSLDDDIIQNAALFTNIRHVAEKLAELSAQDQENLEINLKYAGMYLVLNDLLGHTQEALVAKIETDYKPKVAAVREESRKLREEALAGARDARFAERQREAFASNARANATTMDAADLYRKFLDSQADHSRKSLEELRRNRSLAANTHRTVKNASDLRDVIRSGLAVFDSIQSLSMPLIQPFENEALRREFEEIGRRLRK
jgi:hypothetical protein